jgi:hypothetical protein
MGQISSFLCSEGDARANGQIVATLTDPHLLDGPWDLTINDQGNQVQVFVSNVLNGTVTRIDLSIPRFGTPAVVSATQIASGYLFRSDPAALVVGPTGLAYDASQDILYVASTGDNAIFAIGHASSRRAPPSTGTGNVIYSDDAHLRGPLALAFAPNGNLLTSNGDAINPDPDHQSELIEFTPSGQFVNEVSVDSAASGAAFGFAVQASAEDVRLAAIEENLNTLDIWTTDVGNDILSGDDRSAAGTQKAAAREGETSQAELGGQEMLGLLPAAGNGLGTPLAVSHSLNAAPANKVSAFMLPGRFTGRLRIVFQDRLPGPDRAEAFSTQKVSLNALEDLFTTFRAGIIGLR